MVSILFRWVSTLNGVIVFILFLPGIFVEHDGPGDATNPEMESLKKGLEEVSKGGRCSHVVPIIPKEVLDTKNNAVVKKMDKDKKKEQLENPAPVPKPDLLACSISVWCFFSFYVALILGQT